MPSLPDNLWAPVSVACDDCRDCSDRAQVDEYCRCEACSSKKCAECGERQRHVLSKNQLCSLCEWSGAGAEIASCVGEQFKALGNTQAFAAAKEAYQDAVDEAARWESLYRADIPLRNRTYPPMHEVAA